MTEPSAIEAAARAFIELDDMDSDDGAIGPEFDAAWDQAKQTLANAVHAVQDRPAAVTDTAPVLTPEQVEDAIRHNSPPERFLNGTLIVALATTLQKARAALRAVEWRSCGPTYGGGYCGACGVFKEHTPGCIVGEALRGTP